MKLSAKFVSAFFVLSVLMAFVLVGKPTVYAAITPPPPASGNSSAAGGPCNKDAPSSSSCIYLQSGDNACSVNDTDKKSSCALFAYINDAIVFMSIAVGIIITIMIIVGGIQYTMAGSDPNNVAKAKKRIGTAIGALVGFGLLYAIIQYLVPGGIF